MSTIKIKLQKLFNYKKHYEAGDFRKFNDHMVGQARYHDLENLLHFLGIKSAERHLYRLVEKQFKK